jgi:cytoskeletal protein RodZ
MLVADETGTVTAGAIGATDEESDDESSVSRPPEKERRMRWLAHLAVFVLVLVVLKLFFGWPISIIGSVVLTLILSGVSALINRR